MDGQPEKHNASGTLRGRGINVSSYSWELGKLEQLQNTPHDESMLEKVSQRPTMWAGESSHG